MEVHLLKEAHKSSSSSLACLCCDSTASAHAWDISSLSMAMNPSAPKPPKTRQWYSSYTTVKIAFSFWDEISPPFHLAGALLYPSLSLSFLGSERREIVSPAPVDRGGQWVGIQGLLSLSLDTRRTRTLIGGSFKRFLQRRLRSVQSSSSLMSARSDKSMSVSCCTSSPHKWDSPSFSVCDGRYCQTVANFCVLIKEIHHFC